jgi:hypothetical protein
LWLRHQAGKISLPDYLRADEAIRQKHGGEEAPRRKQLAEIDLKEHETRKSYKMETTATKPKKNR